MFLTIGALGFLQPLVALYLKAAGLRSWQIGLVIGLGTGLAFVLQPVWGHLSDRLDRRRPFLFASAVAAGFAYEGFRFADSPLAFLLLIAAGMNVNLYVNAAVGVLSGRLAPRSGGGALYGSVRIWGSIGFVVVAVLTGLAMQRMSSATLNREQLDTIFTFGPLLFLVLAAVTLVVPDPRAERVVAAADKRLPLTPQLCAFFLAFFLFQYGYNGMLAYLSLYLERLGATPLWITGVWAGGVTAEVLMMSQSGRLSDRFGRRPLLLIPFLVMPVRILLLIPATGPEWVLPVQMLECFCFGIIGAVAVAFVNDLAPEAARGTAQGYLFAMVGLAMALAPLTSGALIEQGGMRLMFLVMAGIAAAGALVFCAFVGESHPARAHALQGGRHALPEPAQE